MNSNDKALSVSRNSVQPCMRLVFAVGYFQRMKGLLFSEPNDATLMIAPCRSIHTVGMRHPIDVAFFDEEGIVLESWRGVDPGCFKRSKHAKGVLERFSYVDDPWFSFGDQVSLLMRETMCGAHLSIGTD